jgi:hypothetical protein
MHLHSTAYSLRLNSSRQCMAAPRHACAMPVPKLALKQRTSMRRDAKVSSNGMATVTVQLSYDKSFPANARSESTARVRAIPGGLTVLPPIVAVVLAIATRNVLVALFCGIWVAAFFIHACAPACKCKTACKLESCAVRPGCCALRGAHAL